MSAAMNDFGLDLAVIGNGRTAALLEPSSRLVWWRFPRFGGDPIIRLTADVPLSYIDREAPFALTKPVYMVIGPDEPFPADLATTCREFGDRTRDYWTEWVRRLSIAYDWQEVIIRAAISLKL